MKINNEKVYPQTTWIWLHPSVSVLDEPYPIRPRLRFGERIFRPVLDGIERWLGPCDLVFIIRDELFELLEKKLKVTPYDPANTFFVKIFLSASIINSSQKKTWIHPRETSARNPKQVLSHWLHQQFTAWIARKKPGMYPLLNIEIEEQNILKAENKFFKIEEPEVRITHPRGKFELLAPYRTKNFDLKNTPFKFGKASLREFDETLDHSLQLVEDEHVIIYWSDQPWLRHLGEGETWYRAGKKWNLMPEGVLVPIQNENLLVLGRMTFQSGIYQPIRGSIVLKYLEYS